MPAPLRRWRKPPWRYDSQTCTAACRGRRPRSRCRGPSRRPRAVSRCGNDSTIRPAEWAVPARQGQAEKASNCPAYSAVNRRASQLSAVLSMVSRACTQARRSPPAVNAASACRSWSGPGPVLGIVDHGEEAAARERQRGVERLRLGARPDLRRGQDLERMAEIERRGAPGLVIVGFEHEFHVQFLARIIRYYGANATSLGGVLYLMPPPLVFLGYQSCLAF